ncbi:MAG: metalloregulator ArsR/SmtB family transcription factor [Solirubrobacterales bacterium]|nr:metalloregulator ArsR/SmtB family transcription factor [Solirubrobacterales bacterium]
MHLVPADRAHRRTIDGHRACQAIEALRRQPVSAWAKRLSLLGEPSRLSLLVCMRDGPISVSDLAIATDLADAKVSQILRLLRAEGIVNAHRDGRIVRYTLGDPAIAHVLDELITVPPTAQARAAT